MGTCRFLYPWSRRGPLRPRPTRRPNRQRPLHSTQLERQRYHFVCCAWQHMPIRDITIHDVLRYENKFHLRLPGSMRVLSATYHGVIVSPFAVAFRREKIIFLCLLWMYMTIKIANNHSHVSTQQRTHTPSRERTSPFLPRTVMIAN